MATDYFGCCVFGVALRDEARNAFDGGFAAAKLRLAQEYAAATPGWADEDWTPEEMATEWYSMDDEDCSWAAVLVAMEEDGSAASVRAMVGAPPYAQFFSSGDDDDRPGRCYTDDGEILCGFGPYGVLKWVSDRFAAEHREAVDFHSWVEAG